MLVYQRVKHVSKRIGIWIWTFSSVYKTYQNRHFCCFLPSNLWGVFLHLLTNCRKKTWISMDQICRSTVKAEALTDFGPWNGDLVHLKNISQLGWLFPIYGKRKNVPNHQPEIVKESNPRWWNKHPHSNYLYECHPSIRWLSLWWPHGCKQQLWVTKTWMVYTLQHINI